MNWPKPSNRQSRRPGRTAMPSRRQWRRTRWCRERRFAADLIFGWPDFPGRWPTHVTKAYAESPLSSHEFLRSICTAEYELLRNYGNLGTAGLGRNHCRQSCWGRVCLWNLFNAGKTAPCLDDTGLSHANTFRVHYPNDAVSNVRSIGEDLHLF